MKKSHIIIIIIAILIIAAGALYYYYFYSTDQLVDVQETHSDVITEEDTEDMESIGENKSKENDEERLLNDEVDDGNKDTVSEDTNLENHEVNDFLDSTVSDENIEKEADDIKLNQVEKKEMSINYPYRNVFRNPFKEYRITEVNSSDVLTIEAIKEMVPFELKGIIGNNYGRLAVINYRNQTRIIREKTEIDEFWILDILDEELFMLYRGVQFKLELRSDIGEGL